MSELTEAQIDAMPAGREMDAEVAMAIGWQAEHYGLMFRFRRSDAQYWEPLPHCSTDIAAAWQVVLALSAKYYIELRLDTVGQPQCWFRTPDLRSHFVSMAGVSTLDEMPLAISRAALKATLRSKEAGR